MRKLVNLKLTDIVHFQNNAKFSKQKAKFSTKKVKFSTKKCQNLEENMPNFQKITQTSKSVQFKKKCEH